MNELNSRRSHLCGSSDDRRGGRYDQTWWQLTDSIIRRSDTAKIDVIRLHHTKHSESQKRYRYRICSRRTDKMSHPKLLRFISPSFSIRILQLDI